MNDGGQTADMAYNLRQTVRSHIGQIACLETPLWSPTLRAAGAVDCVAEWDGRLTICDWKTARRPKLDAYVQDYRLQVTAYQLFHDELFGTSIEDYVIVITCETGEVQIFTGKTADHKAELIARIEAYYDLQADNHMAALAA